MDAEPGKIEGLAHRWFVLYNPLYFFSALCVLGGVFLLSRGFEEIGWRQGKILLTAILEVYQLLLIGAAALLYRVARRHRPAVILGLLAATFFLDATFQTEALASADCSAASAAWAALKAIELLTLLWAFRLRPSAAAFLAPLLAVLLIATTPHWLDHARFEPMHVHLLATWIAAGLAAWFLGKRPAAVSLRRLDSRAEEVLGRAQTAVHGIWLGFVLLHVAGWTVIYDVPVSWAHAVPWLALATLRASEEIHVWIAAASAAGVALTHPPAAAPAMLAVAAILGWRAWREGRHQLLTGVIVALYLAGLTAGWRHGPPPEPGLWMSLVAAAALIVLAWRLRLPAALVPLLAALPELRQRLPELSALQWGTAMLAAGFVSLLAGVALDWRRRTRPLRPSDAAQDTG